MYLADSSQYAPYRQRRLEMLATNLIGEIEQSVDAGKAHYLGLGSRGHSSE
jgi:hypothetical protein